MSTTKTPTDHVFKPFQVLLWLNRSVWVVITFLISLPINAIIVHSDFGPVPNGTLNPRGVNGHAHAAVRLLVHMKCCICDRAWFANAHQHEGRGLSHEPITDEHSQSSNHHIAMEDPFLFIQLSKWQNSTASYWQIIIFIIWGGSTDLCTCCFSRNTSYMLYYWRCCYIMHHYFLLLQYFDIMWRHCHLCLLGGNAPDIHIYILVLSKD